MTYAVARLDEIDEVTDGRCPLRPVRHHLGITAFGVNAWTAREAGDRVINEHDEDEPHGHEELYFVTTGHARFEIDGESVDAPEGTFVFVPPAPKRTAFAEEAGTTIIAIGASSDRPYTAYGWEVWVPLQPLFKEGRYDEVIEQARAIVDKHPYPNVLYNLACAESLAGRTEDAFGHLRQVIELSPQSREYARDDSDFAALREDPRFAELMAEE
jgi:tetratricopeptide (TPR) repeat protein